MAYSHRDRRAHREVFRDFEIVVGAGLALGVLCLLTPWTAVGVGALLGLAVLGVVYVLRADRLLTVYSRDLERVRSGTEGSGFVRAEVASEVGLERTIGRPSSASPHRRRAPITPGGRGDAGVPPANQG
jgi:hypothetical protein